MTASNSSTFQIQIQVIKGRDNDNVSFNIRRYLSITGTCTSAKGFMQNDEDLSEFLIGTKCIACYEESLGQAVLDACQRLFDDRAEKQDPNPIVGLFITANKLSNASGGNLVLDIVDTSVVDIETAKFDNEGFKKRALELRTETAESNSNALAAAQSRKPILKKANQVTSAQQSEEVTKPIISKPVPVTSVTRPTLALPVRKSSIQQAEVIDPASMPF